MSMPVEGTYTTGKRYDFTPRLQCIKYVIQFLLLAYKTNTNIMHSIQCAHVQYLAIWYAKAVDIACFERGNPRNCTGKVSKYGFK